MKQQNLRMPIEGKPDKLKSELSKFIVNVYFEGCSKKVNLKIVLFVIRFIYLYTY